MSISLPNSPVRKIFSCTKCGTISIRFYNPNYDRAYTKSEWEIIMIEGRAALDRILQNVRENPLFFS